MYKCQITSLLFFSTFQIFGYILDIYILLSGKRVYWLCKEFTTLVSCASFIMTFVWCVFTTLVSYVFFITTFVWGVQLKVAKGGAKLIGTVASARPLNSRLYHVYSYKVYLSTMCFFPKCRFSKVYFSKMCFSKVYFPKGSLPKCYVFLICSTFL